MNATDLLNLTCPGLIAKIEANKGLNTFAIEKAKFEGWLKVEFIDILNNNAIKAIPEKFRIDVTFEDAAIELKTINTNYRYNNVLPKTRPITKNVSSVLKDIADLKSKKFRDKFVVFIVFPLNSNNKQWDIQLNKIKERVSDLIFNDFKFNNGIPARIYYGKI